MKTAHKFLLLGSCSYSHQFLFSLSCLTSWLQLFPSHLLRSMMLLNKLVIKRELELSPKIATWSQMTDKRTSQARRSTCLLLRKFKLMMISKKTNLSLPLISLRSTSTIDWIPLKEHSTQSLMRFLNSLRRKNEIDLHSYLNIYCLEIYFIIREVKKYSL